MTANSTESQHDALVQGLQTGDKAAFAEIYRLYSGRLLSTLYKLVKHREEAEEILQDIFVTIWEKRSSLNIHTSLRAYLFRTAENKVHDFFRKARRDHSLHALLLRITTAEYSHIEETLLAKENKHLLQKAIATLPPQRRLVFERCKLQGRSYQEVAEELGISTSTINDHIVKATRSIRDFICANHKILLPLLITSILKDLR